LQGVAFAATVAIESFNYICPGGGGSRRGVVAAVIGDDHDRQADQGFWPHARGDAADRGGDTRSLVVRWNDHGQPPHARLTITRIRSSRRQNRADGHQQQFESSRQREHHQQGSDRQCGRVNHALTARSGAAAAC
jgi:hypothetical protein